MMNWRIIGIPVLLLLNLMTVSAYAYEVPVVDASPAIEMESDDEDSGADDVEEPVQDIKPAQAAPSAPAAQPPSSFAPPPSSFAPAPAPASDFAPPPTTTAKAAVPPPAPQAVGANEAELNAEVTALKQELTQLRMQLDANTKALSQMQLAQTPPPGIGPNRPISAPVQAPQAIAAPPTAKEIQTYQKAYEALRNRDFAAAKNAFSDYLKNFNNGAFASQAHYWLGEVYLQQGVPAKAVTEFTVVTNNPANPKYPEAMLKLGFAYYDQSAWPQARRQLTQVVQQFPGTTVAKLASSRLQDMTQQGH